MPEYLAEIMGDSQLSAERGSACNGKEVDRQKDDVSTSTCDFLSQSIGQPALSPSRFTDD